MIVYLAICRADQFRCQEGLCLTLNSVCNGHPECAGGEDERNCGNSKLLQRRRVIFEINCTFIYKSTPFL